MICSISISGKVCKTSLLFNFFITSSRDINVKPSSQDRAPGKKKEKKRGKKKKSKEDLP